MENISYIKLAINRQYLILAIILGTLVVLPSCKKFVDVPTPLTGISTESAFKEELTATGVLTGIYVRLSNQFNAPNILGASFFTELSGDNLTLFDVNASFNNRRYYRHTLEPTYVDNAGGSYWTNTYNLLYTINSAIEGLTGNSSLTVEVRNRLLGEAYFLRGFCYFYLVNLYGDVPLVLVTDPAKTATLSRNSTSEAYIQILSDLDNAEGLLTNAYVSGDVTKSTIERLRPNLSSVYALQARVFLYQKKYADAEAAATKVISQSDIYHLTSLSETFLANSPETIWSVQSATVGYNTWEGSIFLQPTTGINQNPIVYASSYLMQSFESGDDRKNKWIGYVTVDNGGSNNTYPYPAKYKVPNIPNSTALTEHTIVLRLAEQYLIRAEARNELGNTPGAITDLNVIRTRSRAGIIKDVPNPLPDLSTSLTQLELRPIILHERQVELFTELGHRWFDLKRSGTIDAVLTPVVQSRGGSWSNYKSLYPIPAADIISNNNLNQNPGYTN